MGCCASEIIARRDHKSPRGKADAEKSRSGHRGEHRADRRHPAGSGQWEAGLYDLQADGPALPIAFDIAMGVRHENASLKDYGVPRLDPMPPE
jgi:hypothetical protein